MRPGTLARAGGGPVPAAEPVPKAQWQQIWFAALRRPCSSLVLVPAGPGAPVLFAAEALAAVGRLHGGRAVRLVDAEEAGLTDVADILNSLAAIAGREELAVVAAGCPFTQAAAIPIARAADAALLAVPLGVARFSGARRVVDLVGRERFIGAVTVELGRRG
jgi:hypothetical protein